MTSDTPPVARPVVAVFDFDGTLTRRDTSIPFVLFVLGRVKTWLTIVRLVPLFGLDLLTAFRDERPRRQAGQREPLGGVAGKWETSVHERLLRHCFAGMTADCVFRPKWKVQNGRSGRSVSEEVEGLLRGCGTAIPAHVARPELRRRSTLDN